MRSDKVVLLADGGQAYYDVKTRTASDERTEPYDGTAIDAYLAAASNGPCAYEREICPDEGHELPLMPLLMTAKRRARGKITVDGDFLLVFCVSGARHWYVLNAGDGSLPGRCRRIAIFQASYRGWRLPSNRRYLFGLLSRLCHWNNALVGSQYYSRRMPDVYRPEIYEYMKMLQV